MDVKPRVVAAAGCALLLVVAGPYGGAIGQDISSDAIEQPLSLVAITTIGWMRQPASPGGSETLRRGDVRREWTHVPDLPQQQDECVLAGDALARLAEDPNDPLFLHDGLDDGVFGTSRITEHATVRIEIPLPPAVVLLDDRPQERDPQSRHADDDEHAGARSTADVRHP